MVELITDWSDLRRVDLKLLLPQWGPLTRRGALQKVDTALTLHPVLKFPHVKFTSERRQVAKNRQCQGSDGNNLHTGRSFSSAS